MSAAPSNRNLYAALLGLFLLCWLPVPLPISGWLGDVVSQLMIPVTQPLTQISLALRPEPGVIDEGDPAVMALKTALAKLETRNALLESENALLQVELHSLRDLASLTGGDEFFPLHVQRAGSAPASRGGIFHVNAGATRGVELGTVVVVPPTQLAGIVTAVNSLSATVTPLTAEGFELIEVRIDRPDLSFADDPKGTLEADGEGRLAGLFETALLERLGVAVGDNVRLDDPRIGAAHTGLLVGVVEEMRDNDANPLHRRLFVRPLANPERQSVYYLMVPKVNRRGGNGSRSGDANGGG